MQLRFQSMGLKVAAVAAVLVVGALAGSACSTVNPDAATVNGDSISRGDFNSTLDAYTGNSAFIALVSQTGTGSVTGSGSETVSADFARQALQREIIVLVAEQQNDERGATVTPEIEAAAKADVEAQFGLEVFNAFPESFQQTLVDQNAQIFTLRASVAGSALDDAALQAAYDEDPSQFDEVCASHILVGTQEEADAVEDRLAAGEDFGAIAAEVSIDTGSASSGGALGCVPRGVTVPEFEAAMFATPVGEISDPVQTQFGYHVIMVTDRKAPSFEEAKPLVLQRVLDDSNADFNDVLNAALDEATVTVDPRYGTWNPSLNSVVPTDFADLEGSTDTGTEAPVTTGG